MTENEFGPEWFPSFVSSVRARWAPIILEPISSSPERLVIGCAVAGDAGWHIEMANALHRLTCFYGDQSDAVIMAITFAHEALAAELSSRGDKALEQPNWPLTGLALGQIREGQGNDLREIGSNWMSVLSSLYDPNMAISKVDSNVVQLADRRRAIAEPFATFSEPLPTRVLRQVSGLNLELSRYFNQDIRDGRTRRRNFGSHEVLIDFSGKKLVANFATLTVGKLSVSANNIKQRLWDLKVDRDSSLHEPFRRAHELIVTVPQVVGPEVTKSQLQNIQVAFSSLEKQADDEQLRLRPFETTEEIGAHIIKEEAA